MCLLLKCAAAPLKPAPCCLFTETKKETKSPAGKSIELALADSALDGGSCRPWQVLGQEARFCGPGPGCFHLRA